MNKSVILTLLLAVSSAIALLYFIGVFDSPETTISIQTNIPISNESTTQEIPIPSIENKEVETTKLNLSKTEVAKHSTKDNCWMIIDGNVYNFTSYILQHPGGQKTIIQECGGDGTGAFTDERKHLRPNVQSLLTNYLLGELEK